MAPVKLKLFANQFTGVMALIGFVGSASSGGLVDYQLEVKPLLTEHCYRCHGASQQKGGLRVDTAGFILKGGDHGPACVIGKSDKSILMQVIKGMHDDISRMPFKKLPLRDAQILTLGRWIDEGAQAPSDEAPQSDQHWAFVVPVHPSLPTVKQVDWPRNGIDYFILARLESERIKPSLEADRVTLIRRASLDLTGLPPTPAEVELFVQDQRGDAYEQLIDRLLASPHYGERWGRHWLDVARYADSNGYSIDAPRTIWKYRDWVIDALNRNLPYNQFVIDQLAGDLLPDATMEQKIATGFHRNTQINQEGGIDPEQFRIESVLDRVNTTGTAFLGLTVACAQCHDHKFDPISQREYYSLFAFFNNQEEPNLEVGTPEEFAQRKEQREKINNVEAELEAYVASLAPRQPTWEANLRSERRSGLKPEVKAALAALPGQRTEAQKKALSAAFREQDAGYAQLKKKRDRLKHDELHIPTTMVLQERDQPRESYVFIKGDFTRKGDTVTPGTLKILNAFPAKANPNRLDLARWIVDPQNPLTARVEVNRVWQRYFGRGLVATENDFGTQGIPPTHPELLDWLATEFIAQHWNLKAMHRLIVTSATYRQSSRVRPELAKIDGNNKLLARQFRLRLDAEIVRDVGLSASGLLSPKIGGPSVFPPQPDGVMNLGQSKRNWTPDEGDDRFRRGMYTFFWRATPHPALMVFDGADAFSACTRRLRSNTPLQALTLLNDLAFLEFAQAMAARILREGATSDSARVERAFRWCLARKPWAQERERLLKLLTKEKAAFQKAPGEALAMSGGRKDPTLDLVQLAAWTTVSRVLLNLDETITRE